jgi:uncharacterized protein YoxC
MLSNLNSLQTTISDLAEIVDRNQGANHETTLLVKQMQQLVDEMERKARKRKPIVDVVPMPQLGHGIPVV